MRTHYNSCPSGGRILIGMRGVEGNRHSITQIGTLITIKWYLYCKWWFV